MPEIHFDWKGLPAIQRSIADHPLTVPIESFASDLATHDDPRTLAKPLGHHVSLEAPPGIVLGIARTQTRNDGPALISRPRAGRGPAVQRIIDQSVVSEADAEQLEQTDTEESAAPVTPPRRLAASTEPMPSVQLMRVTPETEPRPIEPEVSRPSEEPAAAAAEAAQPVEATAEIPSYPRLTLGQARRLGLGPPIKHVPETATSVQRITEVSTRSAEPTTHPSSGIQEQSAPKFEPFVLDFLVNKKEEVKAPAPISRPQRIPLSVSRSTTAQPSETGRREPASEPPTPSETEDTTPPEIVEESASDSTATSPSTPAVVQRDAETAEADDVPVQLTRMSIDAPSIEPTAGPPPIAAATDPKRTLLADAPEGEAGEGEGEALPPLPLALGTSPKESEVEISKSEISSRSIVPPSPAEDSPTQPASPMAPLISRRPQLVTHASPPIAASVQRSAESTAPTIQRAVDTAPATGFATSDAGHRGELPRSSATISGLELPSQPVPSPSAVGGDVAIASTSPMTRPPVPTSLPLARPSQPVFLAGPSVQRSASIQASAEPERWSQVQTSTAALEPESEEPSVSMQRAVAREWTVSAAAEPESSGPSLVAAAEATPHASPEVDDEGRMEDLAARLYDRLRMRLRNELLVDRERAGFLTDLR